MDRAKIPKYNWFAFNAKLFFSYRTCKNPCHSSFLNGWHLFFVRVAPSKLSFFPNVICMYQTHKQNVPYVLAQHMNEKQAWIQHGKHVKNRGMQPTWVTNITLYSESTHNNLSGLFRRPFASVLNV